MTDPDNSAPANPAPPGILPNDPAHMHYGLYRHMLQGVQGAAPGYTAEQQGNLAAGLVDAWLQSRPAEERRLRADESTIRDLQVVPGTPGAETPSLFVVSAAQPAGEATPRISTPLAIADVPASQTLAGHAQQRSIGADGFLTDPNITRTHIPALERDPMAAVNGIVLHRTMGSTAAGTLSHWRGQDNPHGTHFLIDRDGTIHQTASLNDNTSHVGRIRSRAEVEGSLTEEGRQELAATRARPTNDYQDVHRLEAGRPYPQRYPTNGDSVGIEVVATYDERSGRWQEPTEQQLASVRRLVGILQNNYGLNDRDIYQHDVISYKTQGEGADLYRPEPRAVDAPGVQPAQPGVGPPR